MVSLYIWKVDNDGGVEFSRHCSDEELIGNAGVPGSGVYCYQGIREMNEFAEWSNNEDFDADSWWMRFIAE